MSAFGYELLADLVGLVIIAATVYGAYLAIEAGCLFVGWVGRCRRRARVNRAIRILRSQHPSVRRYRVGAR